MEKTDVLIVGAGPTGLVLALFLAKAGVRALIVDKNEGPGMASRAMAVQARTLEFYRQLEFADEVIAKGIVIDQLQLRTHNEVVARVDITEFGRGLSPFPFILSFPQDDHERLLVDKLADAGVEVTWKMSLSELHDDGDNVVAHLTDADGNVKQISARYVCGCDGAHSTVRRESGLTFAGGTYQKIFFVADVRATGDATQGHVFTLCLLKEGPLIVLPIRSTLMTRLIGIVPEELQGKDDLSFDDVRSHVEQEADVHVESVNWFSSYHVSHRVTDHFRAGRVFVAGDAGHIHSPVGGQGMNTGIGDAVNLSWKLAAVINGTADASILETYEPERIAFARSLVSTTDKVFQIVTGVGPAYESIRETLAPHLAPFALGFSGLRTAAYRLVSQIRINYRDSELSVGSIGGIEAGDRLPWIVIDSGGNNFDVLCSLDWQVHIYGVAEQTTRTTAAENQLELAEFAWNDAMKKSGIHENTLYLIRPDGYIGLAARNQDTDDFRMYLAKFKITGRHRPQ